MKLSLVGVLVVLLAQQNTSAVPGMSLIPEGEFWMGRYHLWLSDELGWTERDRQDDRPVHRVHVDAFLIDQKEVSNSDYLKFVEAAQHRRPHHWVKGQISKDQEQLPVYNVSWVDARTYCTWAGKRLPTEAEWERAARGGVDKTLYFWGDDLGGRRERTNENATLENVRRAQVAGAGGPTAVGSFAANAYGVFDATGNVWEWVEDWYERDYYSISPDRNPKGPSTGSYRVIRGGSWADTDERILGLHYRNYTNPDVRTPTIGFRCARNP